MCCEGHHTVSWAGLVLAVETARPAQGCFIMAPHHSVCSYCCVLALVCIGQGMWAWPAWEPCSSKVPVRRLSSRASAACRLSRQLAALGQRLWGGAWGCETAHRPCHCGQRTGCCCLGPTTAQRSCREEGSWRARRGRTDFLEETALVCGCNAVQPLPGGQGPGTCAQLTAATMPLGS